MRPAARALCSAEWGGWRLEKRGKCGVELAARPPRENSIPRSTSRKLNLRRGRRRPLSPPTDSSFVAPLQSVQALGILRTREEGGAMATLRVRLLYGGVDQEFTRTGSYEELARIREELLLAWHGPSRHVLTFKSDSGEEISFPDRHLREVRLDEAE